VATILEGGVQRSGERVRINAQLIDAATDEHLWAEQYNRELTDVFAIQTDVALQIAGALKARLSADERGQLERRPTESLEAWNLYLQGRYLWNKRTREGLESGIEYFERAIELDQEYALAWVGVADSYTILATWGYMSPEEALAKASVAATRALQIDETLGEAHVAKAAILAEEWDWAAAGAAYARGLELSPGYATGHQWRGTYLGTTGRVEECLRELELAQELDPLSLIITANLGMTLGWLGRFDEAEATLRRALDLDPDFISSLQEIGYILEAESRFDEALEVYQHAIEVSGGLVGYGESGHVYGVMGRRSEALDRLATLEAEAKIRYVPPGDFALVHAGLGNTDLAFRFLEDGYRQRDATLKWRILSPQLADLRSDPRMVNLMGRMGIGGR
jgi:tetratricopeptide (TPR) repeat protein